MLTERADHLRHLENHLSLAARDCGQIVVVGGKAGAGKTALVRAFIAEGAIRARVLFGTCDALSTPRVLAPFLDIARIDRRVAQAVAQGASADLIATATLAALQSGPRPVLLVIEDAHWADAASLDVIRYLGRRLPETRAMLIVTYRNDEVTLRHPLVAVLGYLAMVADLRSLHLPPRSVDAVTTLTEGTRVDPIRLHALTGGNPFLVTDVAAAGGVPQSVQQVMLARAANLPAAAWEVLDALAVLGSVVETAVLHQVLAPAPGCLEQCLATGMILASGDTIVFRHERTREAILSTIPPLRRRALHAAVLNAMAGAPETVDPARLAYHAEGAGAGELVVEFATAAAKRATALGAHSEAADHYEQAARFSGSLSRERRAELFEAGASAHFLAARVGPAIAARQSALALWTEVGDARKRGENLSQLAVLHWAAAEIDAADQHARAAVDLLEPLGDEAGLAVAYGTLARIRTTVDDIDAAVGWGERAIALAGRGDDGATLADALITVGVTRLAAGDDRGRSEIERGLEIARAMRLDHLVVRAYYSLGVGLGEQYRFGAAVPHFEAAIDVAADRNLDHQRLMATAWLAYCRMFQGRWDAAADLAISALPASNQSPIVSVTALHVLGLIRARRGEEGAEALLDEALALAEGSGGPARIGPIRAARAEAAWLRGDPPAVLAEAAAVAPLEAKHGRTWWGSELAYWRWRVGDVPPTTMVPGPYAWQVAGEWEQAADAWDGLGCVYEAARARAEGTSRAGLQAALMTFDRLLASPAGREARRRWRDLGWSGVPRGPNRSTRSNSALLTRRQVQILALVADGCDNGEIATRLFLSKRTVEAHLFTLFTKLGVETREAAASMARERGLVTPVPGEAIPVRAAVANGTFA